LALPRICSNVVKQVQKIADQAVAIYHRNHQRVKAIQRKLERDYLVDPLWIPNPLALSHRGSHDDETIEADEIGPELPREFVLQWEASVTELKQIE
jgi:hypothetical protein